MITTVKGKRKTRAISDNLKLLKALARKEFLKCKIKEINESKKEINNWKKDGYKCKDINAMAMVKEKYPEIDPSYFLGIEGDGIWDGTAQSQNPHYEENLSIMSDKGVMMRSKSERIIAARLDYYEIPYAYEAPLKLRNGDTIYPDFTIINPVTKEKIYWEHFGMMDEKGYQENAFKKIKKLIENGIIPGENLIMTFETSKGINIKDINEKIMGEL